MCRLTFVGTIIIVILSEAKNLPKGWVAAKRRKASLRSAGKLKIDNCIES